MAERVRNRKSASGFDGISYTMLCKSLRVAPSTLTREALARGFMIKFDSGNRIPVSEVQEIHNFIETLRADGVIPQVGQRMKYSRIDNES